MHIQHNPPRDEDLEAEIAEDIQRDAEFAALAWRINTPWPAPYHAEDWRYPLFNVAFDQAITDMQRCG